MICWALFGGTFLVIPAVLFGQAAEPTDKPRDSGDAAAWLRYASQEEDKVGGIQGLEWIAQLQGDAKDKVGLDQTATRLVNKLLKQTGPIPSAYDYDAYAELAGAYAQCDDMENFKKYAAKTDFKERPNAVIMMYAVARDYPAMEKALAEGQWEGNQNEGAYCVAALRVARDSRDEAEKVLQAARERFKFGAATTKIARTYADLGDMVKALTLTQHMGLEDKTWVMGIVVNKLHQDGSHWGARLIEAEIVRIISNASDDLHWQRFSWPMVRLYDHQMRLGRQVDALETLQKMVPQGQLPTTDMERGDWCEQFETVIRLAEESGYGEIADRDLQIALRDLGEESPEGKRLKHLLIDMREHKPRRLSPLEAFQALPAALALKDETEQLQAIAEIYRNCPDIDTRMTIIQQYRSTSYQTYFIRELVPILVRAEENKRTGNAAAAKPRDLWTWVESLADGNSRVTAAEEIGQELITLRRQVAE